MSSSSVIGGGHMDYTRSIWSRWQWTLPEFYAGALVQLLGILITIALAQLFTLTQSVYRAVQKSRASLHPAPAPAPGLVPAASQAPPTRPFISLVQYGTMMAQEARDEYRTGRVRLPNSPPAQRAWGKVWMRVAYGALAFVAYAGTITLGVVSNGLEGDSKVLQRSKACGIYHPSAERDILSVTTPFETRAQSEAQAYADLCYRRGEMWQRGCDIFYQPTISYNVLHNQSCPFADEMCFLGADSAITLTTGIAPAKSLGINTGSALEFERSSTCAPLNMNNTYVVYGEEPGLEPGNCTGVFYSYRYGSFSGSSMFESIRTFTYGNFYEKTPSYYVNALVYSQGKASDNKTAGFIPIPELSTGNGTMLTLLFILPGKIYYTAPSEDPIFRATFPTQIPSTSQQFWMYTGGYARVLACVDRARWRDLRVSTDWHERDEAPITATPETWPGDAGLLWASLLPSNIYQTIGNRLAAVLNATSLITLHSSLPLAPEQWKVEATQLFENSLARAQFEARYIAEGVLASYPGYERNDAPVLNDKICSGVYIYNDPSYRNINGAAYLSVLIASSLIIFLSLGDKTLLWERLLGSCGFQPDAVVSSIARGLKHGANSLWDAFKLLVQGTWSLLHELWRITDASVCSCTQTLRGVWQAGSSGTSAGTRFVTWVRQICS